MYKMGVIFNSCVVCNEARHEDSTAYCEECNKYICDNCTTWKYIYEEDKRVFEGGCPSCNMRDDRDAVINEIVDLSNDEQKEKIMELCNRLRNL